MVVTLGILEDVIRLNLPTPSCYKSSLKHAFLLHRNLSSICRFFFLASRCNTRIAYEKLSHALLLAHSWIFGIKRRFL
ncbi:hypothetical protein HanIR_Chr03g0108951 [Helianthus annuus]|nr:hypothetical protein HanIR_Chr03g0108951 [Helianthus annuus]